MVRTEAHPVERPGTHSAELHRYDRESIEFGRIINLSDAVFAIALTLLVLTLDTLEVTGLLTFGVAFYLVANVWWQHHRVLAQLAWFEPGLAGINLAVLAGVALAPFPTSLVAADPTSRSAVLAFVSVFAALSALTIVLIVRAHVIGAWRHHLPRRLARWILTDWLANLAVLVTCLVIAMFAPVAALVVLLAGSTVTHLTVSQLGPRERRAWF